MNIVESLSIGEEYTLDDFEEIFDTSFGYPVGINYRNPDDRQRFIVLFSKEGGPCSQVQDAMEEPVAEAKEPEYPDLTVFRRCIQRIPTPNS